MNKEVAPENYEILVLLAVDHLGGQAKRDAALELMEKEMMPEILAKYPEEQKDRESTPVPVWKNKASFARENLRKNGFLNMPEHGIWEITEESREILAGVREKSDFSIDGLRQKSPRMRAKAYLTLFEAKLKISE